MGHLITGISSIRRPEVPGRPGRNRSESNPQCQIMPEKQSECPAQARVEAGRQSEVPGAGWVRDGQDTSAGINKLPSLFFSCRTCILSEITDRRLPCGLMGYGFSGSIRRSRCSGMEI